MNIKKRTKQNNKEDDHGDNEIIHVPLTKSKEYASALNHFVVNNMWQNKQLLEISDTSYKIVQAINRMVESSTIRQRTVSEYFPPD